jgi:Fe-S-cluster-containing hydrogenase component 2
VKIDERCISCKSCIPYCPVGAIVERENRVHIDQDLCVECGVCHRAKVCPADAIYQSELAYPRTLRTQFSNPVAYRHPTAIGGRGTDEMKTNDVTDRFKLGEVGFCIELGRPGFGTDFDDLEKVTIQLTKIGVEFEPENPTTLLVDRKTGKLKDEAIRKERVLSCIVECKTPEEEIVDVMKTLEDVSRKVNTVLSVGIISRCRNGEIPAKLILDKAGIKTYINGKVNLGLGKVGLKS